MLFYHSCWYLDCKTSATSNSFQLPVLFHQLQIAHWFQFIRADGSHIQLTISSYFPTYSKWNSVPWFQNHIFSFFVNAILLYPPPIEHSMENHLFSIGNFDGTQLCLSRSYVKLPRGCWGLIPVSKWASPYPTHNGAISNLRTGMSHQFPPFNPCFLLARSSCSMVKKQNTKSLDPMNSHRNPIKITLNPIKIP